MERFHALSAKLDPRVAHYSGQAELAAAIQHGLAARASGDLTTATAMLGRAVQLAALTGHDDSARLLARLVEVIDAATGTVRLRDDAAGVDAELANVRSVKTVRSRTVDRRTRAVNNTCLLITAAVHVCSYPAL